MSDATWPAGILCIDPQGTLNHEDVLRVMRGIADARPKAVLYTNPWIIAPAPNCRHLLLYRVGWKRGWVGTSAVLVQRVRAYYENHQ